MSRTLPPPKPWMSTLEQLRENERLALSLHFTSAAVDSRAPAVSSAGAFEHWQDRAKRRAEVVDADNMRIGARLEAIHMRAADTEPPRYLPSLNLTRRKEELERIAAGNARMLQRIKENETRGALAASLRPQIGMVSCVSAPTLPADTTTSNTSHPDAGDSGARGARRSFPAAVAAAASSGAVQVPRHHSASRDHADAYLQQQRVLLLQPATRHHPLFSAAARLRRKDRAALRERGAALRRMRQLTTTQAAHSSSRRAVAGTSTSLLPAFREAAQLKALAATADEDEDAPGNDPDAEADGGEIMAAHGGSGSVALTDLPSEDVTYAEQDARTSPSKAALRATVGGDMSSGGRVDDTAHSQPLRHAAGAGLAAVRGMAAASAAVSRLLGDAAAEQLPSGSSSIAVAYPIGSDTAVPLSRFNLADLVPITYEEAAAAIARSQGPMVSQEQRPTAELPLPPALASGGDSSGADTPDNGSRSAQQAVETAAPSEQQQSVSPPPSAPTSQQADESYDAASEGSSRASSASYAAAVAGGVRRRTGSGDLETVASVRTSSAVRTYQTSTLQDLSTLYGHYERVMRKTAGPSAAALPPAALQMLVDPGVAAIKAPPGAATSRGSSPGQHTSRHAGPHLAPAAESPPGSLFNSVRPPVPASVSVRPLVPQLVLAQPPEMQLLPPQGSWGVAVFSAGGGDAGTDGDATAPALSTGAAALQSLHLQAAARGGQDPRHLHLQPLPAVAELPNSSAPVPSAPTGPVTAAAASAFPIWGPPALPGRPLPGHWEAQHSVPNPPRGSSHALAATGVSHSSASVADLSRGRHNANGAKPKLASRVAAAMPLNPFALPPMSLISRADNLTGWFGLRGPGPDHPSSSAGATSGGAMA